MRETITQWKEINRFKAGNCPDCVFPLFEGKCLWCGEEWTEEKVWNKFHSEREISVREFLGVTPEKKKLVEKKAELLKQIKIPFSDELIIEFLADYQKSEEDLRKEVLALEKSLLEER